MRRLKIYHRTRYVYSGQVTLGTHYLLVRPREGHEVHIESSGLEIQPAGRVQWHRDVDNNSVAVVDFDMPTNELVITSELVCQHYNSAPLDFMVDESAVNYPFTYEEYEAVVLLPYRICNEPVGGGELHTWLTPFWKSDSPLQTYGMLERLCSEICQQMTYEKREEEGVQTVIETLSIRKGSCRDFANLFVESARMLGVASRFVSGYLYNPPSDIDYGATHAWAEVYLPGAGWKGFDPTMGRVTSNDHITVAVSRRPDRVPPVSGTYAGSADSELQVEVQVTSL